MQEGAQDLDTKQPPEPKSPVMGTCLRGHFFRGGVSFCHPQVLCFLHISPLPAPAARLACSVAPWPTWPATGPRGQGQEGRPCGQPSWPQVPFLPSRVLSSLPSAVRNEQCGLALDLEELLVGCSLAREAEGPCVAGGGALGHLGDWLAPHPRLGKLTALKWLLLGAPAWVT